MKAGQANNQKNGGMVSKAGYLKAQELLFRELTTRSTPNLKEYFLYTTFNLFEQVELSATRFCVATKTPAGVIVAAKVDPRFAKDKEAISEPMVRDHQERGLAMSCWVSRALFRGGLLCQGDPLDQAARRDLRRIPPGLLRTSGMVRRGCEPHACRVAEDHPLRGESVPRQARQRRRRRKRRMKQRRTVKQRRRLRKSSQPISRSLLPEGTNAVGSADQCHSSRRFPRL